LSGVVLITLPSFLRGALGVTKSGSNSSFQAVAPAG
jgi:hypothetical protein